MDCDYVSFPVYFLFFFPWSFKLPSSPSHWLTLLPPFVILTFQEKYQLHQVSPYSWRTPAFLSNTDSCLGLLHNCNPETFLPCSNGLDPVFSRSHIFSFLSLFPWFLENVMKCFLQKGIQKKFVWKCLYFTFPFHW